MDKSLTQETEEQIRVLCDEIVSAEGLSAELHKELCTHVEDKLLGYLSGEVALSEADALVLAREHFGDRKALGVQLEEVHPSAVSLKIFRPVLVASILFVVLNIPYKLLFSKTFYITAGIMTGSILVYPSLLLILGLYIWGYNKILMSWKERELNHHPCWYHRLSTKQLVGILGVLILVKKPIHAFMSMLLNNVVYFQESFATKTTSYFVSSQYIILFMYCSVIGSLAGGIWIWFKWLEVPWKPTSKMLKTIGAFVVFGVCNAFGSVFYLIYKSPDGIFRNSQKSVILAFENVQVLFNTTFYITILLALQNFVVAAVCTSVVYSLVGFLRNWKKTKGDRPFIAG